MPVSLRGFQGWATRIGKILKVINSVNTYLKTTTDSLVTSVMAEYITEEQIAVDGYITARNLYRDSHTQWLNRQLELALSTTINQVDRAYPLVNRNITEALSMLIRQFATQGETFARPTTSLAVNAPSTNYGNGVIVGSLIDGNGLTLDMVIPETLSVTITSDSSSGGTAFQEQFRIRGMNTGNPLLYNWRMGSGANVSGSFIDASTSSGTILKNGSFNTWADPAAMPADWTSQLSTIGATLSRTTSSFRGDYAMNFVGDGSQLTSIYQTLENIKPSTVYCVSVWLKITGTPTQGTLKIRLADDAGQTIKNDQLADNALTIDCTSLTPVFVNRHVFFQTPRFLPDVIRLYVNLSQPLTANVALTIDHMAMVPATQIYPGGPYIAAFSGDSRASILDTYEIVVTNSHNENNFIPALDRLFNLRANNLRFPTTSGTATISDSLIQ